MKKVRIEAMVDDDFEKGCCFDCPFNYFDEHCDICCALFWQYNNCKLEIIEEDKDD